MDRREEGEEGLKTPQGPPRRPPHLGDGRKRRCLGSGCPNKASQNRKQVSAQGVGWAGSSTRRCRSPAWVLTGSSLCVYLGPNLFSQGHRPDWIKACVYDLILTSLPFQRPCLQIQSHSEVLGVKTST